MARFISDLSQHPQEYDFAQAMRLLKQFQQSNEKRIRIDLKGEAMPHGSSDEIQYFSFKGNRAKLRLAKQALFGVKGVIPNYIYEEMLSALHKEKRELKDFLDVFNQRHFELINSVDQQRWLLLEKEQSDSKTYLLHQVANLTHQQPDFFQYSLLLTQQSRSLPVLHQLLNDYFPYDMSVQCKQGERHHVAKDSLSRLGCSLQYNSRVGQGLLLGKTCITQFNHLLVAIRPTSRQEFEAMQNDKGLSGAIVSLVHHYLRDQTPVSVYLNVKRDYLSRPVMSAKKHQAARLGEVDCLAPERKPQELIRILLR